MKRYALGALISVISVGCGSGGGSGSTGTGGKGSGGISGGATGGTAGSGSGGAGTGGAAGSAAGSGGATVDAGASDHPSAEVAAAGCPTGAVICEDFEKYTDGATDLTPGWEGYGYVGTVKVDSSKPHAGNRSLHLTAKAGAMHYADIVRQTQDGSAVVPLVHYGRVMVWLTEVPGASHWTISHAAGPPPDDRTKALKFSEGGEAGVLLAGYSVRPRPLAPNGMFLLRGGGQEPADPTATADCHQLSKTEKMPAQSWVCWEWKFDGSKNDTKQNELHLWVNGVPQTEVDVVGKGNACSTGNMAQPWLAPVAFTKLIIGWEQYQGDAPDQEAWLDDLVISTEKVGCP